VHPAANSLLITLPEAAAALSAMQGRLGRSLHAVYLHGSAVTGGLRPRSDVDLLAVVDQPIPPQARKTLVTDLLDISGRYPSDPYGRRPLELIVFLQPELAELPYPAPGEFIYGEWLRHSCEAGNVPPPSGDPELTLVLAQARHEALALMGPAAKRLLPDIPRADIRRAIKDTLPALIGTLEGDERNVLLTLARMWYTLETDGFAPKDMAAGWVAARMPAEQRPLLTAAAEAYANGCDCDWRHCRQELSRTTNMLYNNIIKSIHHKQNTAVVQDNHVNA